MVRYPLAWERSRKSRSIVGGAYYSKAVPMRFGRLFYVSCKVDGNGDALTCDREPLFRARMGEAASGPIGDWRTSRLPTPNRAASLIIRPHDGAVHRS